MSLFRPTHTLSFDAVMQNKPSTAAADVVSTDVTTAPPLPTHNLSGQLSTIESRATLNVFMESGKVRLTKIVCTIGPATQSVPALQELIGAGMGVARLNFSHGTHDYHAQTIRNLREAAAGSGNPLGIALDTKGPEIRTGFLSGGQQEVVLHKDAMVSVSVNENDRTNGTADLIFVDYPRLPLVCSAGSRIFVDDGNICLVVVEEQIELDLLRCRVEAGGILKNQKGVNLPGTPVDLPAITQTDREDIVFGVGQKVDFIFASFIRNAEGVREIRRLVEQVDGRSKIWIISKIESKQGLDNFDEILSESDGIMVARGDMGVEIEAEQVFAAQRMIVAKAQLAGKPVIVATQMLDSMTKHNRPTRAEVTDVGFAVSEGCDAVMLSAETASGQYPTEAVQMQDRICRLTECSFPYVDNLFEIERNLLSSQKEPIDLTSHIMLGAAHAALVSQAVAVIVLTDEGGSVLRLSKYRLRCPIIAVTRNAATARRLTLVRNCFPVLLEHPPLKNLEEDRMLRIEAGQSEVISLGLKTNSTCSVVVAMGEVPNVGRANSLYVCSL